MSQSPAVPYPEKSTNVRSLPWQMTALRWTLRGVSSVAPSWSARVALALFLRPRRHRRPVRERDWLRTARRFDVPLDGGRLAAWSWGEGPPVLLVHGWEGRGGQMGAFVEPLTAAGHRVVTFDAPGHGESSGSTSSFPEMARAIEKMVMSTGPLAGVVAHSAGAPVLGYRLARGLAANRVALVSPGVYPVRYPRGFGRFMGLQAPAVRRMEQLMKARFGVHPLDFGAERWAPDRRVPLLAVTDRDDDEVPVSDVESLARLWPDSRIHVTSGLGHRRILRDPGVVSEIVGFVTE